MCHTTARFCSALGGDGLRTRSAGCSRGANEANSMQSPWSQWGRQFWWKGAPAAKDNAGARLRRERTVSQDPATRATGVDLPVGFGHAGKVTRGAHTAAQPETLTHACIATATRPDIVAGWPLGSVKCVSMRGGIAHNGAAEAWHCNPVRFCVPLQRLCAPSASCRHEVGMDGRKQGLPGKRERSGRQRKACTALRMFGARTGDAREGTRRTGTLTAIKHLPVGYEHAGKGCHAVSPVTRILLMCLMPMLTASPLDSMLRASCGAAGRAPMIGNFGKEGAAVARRHGPA